MHPMLSCVWGGSCGPIITQQFLLGVNIPSIHVIKVFQDTINVLDVVFLTTEKWWNYYAKSSR